MTTAQLFAEALDTVSVLLRAGATWFVLGAVVATLALYAVVITVWVTVRGVFRMLAAARAATASRQAWGGPWDGAEGADVHGGPEAVHAPHVPSWARDGHDDDIEEAA